MFFISHRIVCWTGEAAEEFSDVVTVNVSREGRSRDRFSYVVRHFQFLLEPLSLNLPLGGRGRSLLSSLTLFIYYNVQNEVTLKASLSTVSIESFSIIH